MDPTPVSAPKRRILNDLKQSGEATASTLAERLHLTDVGVRQHLTSLERIRMVVSRPLTAVGRGRPAVTWRLTRLGHRTFPERHAELTVELIAATRKALGDDALQRVIQARAEAQTSDYRRRLPLMTEPLEKRVEALATIRTQDGYMAEVVTEKPGQYLLIEHHCPICAAAQSCTGLCAAELDVFRQSLGQT